MLQLLLSTRWDPHLLQYPWNNDNDGPSAFFLLPFHFERLQLSLTQHGWSSALTYPRLKALCLDAISHSDQPAAKIRVTLSRDDQLAVTLSPAIPFSSDPMSPSGSIVDLYLDSHSTPSSLFTTTKTTHRHLYDQARLRAHLPPLSPILHADVILHNNAFITETSICNIAFFRNGQWQTPPSNAGGYNGVLRRWLLQNNRIVEVPIPLHSIHVGDPALVFNAVQGCRLATVKST